MATSFVLHPQLELDTIPLGTYPLCRVLLMNDANYPWLIAVPQRANISEIYQLKDHEQAQLTIESALIGQTIMHLFSGDKLNIGALGNVVPQLHVHHIVRLHDDPAWPAPVWGHAPAYQYNAAELQKVSNKISRALSASSEEFSLC